MAPRRSGDGTLNMGSPCTACACGLPARPSPAPRKAIIILDAGLLGATRRGLGSRSAALRALRNCLIGHESYLHGGRTQTENDKDERGKRRHLKTRNSTYAKSNGYSNHEGASQSGGLLAADSRTAQNRVVNMVRRCKLACHPRSCRPPAFAAAPHPVHSAAAGRKHGVAPPLVLPPSHRCVFLVCSRLVCK